MTVLVLTVGEKITFDTLKSLKCLPEHHLTIWYTGDNKRFYRKLRKYTEDIIMSCDNKGLGYSLGCIQLYGKYKYLVALLADNVLNPDFYRKVKPFLDDDSVGMLGQSQHELNKPYIYCNNEDFFPDNFWIFKKSFINDMGACTPSHPVYGHICIDLYYRALKHSNWKIVCFNNDYLGLHGGINKDTMGGCELIWKDDGVEAMRTIMYKTDHEMWMRCAEKNFEGYNWWSTDL